MNRWKMVWLTLAILMGTSVSAEELALNKGKWEFSIQSGMTHASNIGKTNTTMSTKKTKRTQCLTRKSPVPPSWPGECKVEKYQIKGNTVIFSVVCETKSGPVAGEGTATYDGDAMRGRMEMRSGQLVIINLIKGKRIGKCE